GGSMSYVHMREPRHTVEEYERYTPNEYRRVLTVVKILGLFGLIFLIFVGYFVYLNSAGHEHPSWLQWGLAASFVIFLIAGTALMTMGGNLDSLVDNALLKERDALHTQVAKMENDIKSVADRVRYIKATGHVVMARYGK